MSDPNVVNLNKARKAKARDVKRARAGENAVRFGRSKADKNKQTVEDDKANKHLDGHKREP